MFTDPVTQKGRGWIAGVLLALAFGPTVLSAAVSGPTTGSINLKWDPNPEPEVIGYRIHLGETSGAYTRVVDVGDVTNTTIDGLVVGATYFCAATAYNVDGLEGPYSDEISFTVQSTPSTPSTPVDLDADGLADHWEITYGGAGGLEADDDLNGDGLAVLAEYAHGLDPLAPSNRAVVEVETTQTQMGRCLAIRYRVDPLAEQFVTIHVERSLDPSDPSGWQRGFTTVISSAPLTDGSGLVEIVSRSLSPMSAQPREFLRLAYEARNGSTAVSK